MKKKNLFAFVCFTLCVCMAAIMLTGCNSSTSTYKLYMVCGGSETWELGDTYRHAELNSNTVVLILNNNGTATLTFENKFLDNSPTSNGYTTFSGTYTINDSYINLLVPKYDSNPIVIVNTGNIISFKRSSTINYILKK